MMDPSTDRAAERRAEPHDLGREVSEDVHRALGRRTARPGTLSARAEEEIKRGGVRVLGELRRRPSLGVLLFGGLAIVAADAIGVGELAMGIGIGYAAWQVLRRGEPVGEALEQASKLTSM